MKIGVAVVRTRSCSGGLSLVCYLTQVFDRELDTVFGKTGLKVSSGYSGMAQAQVPSSESLVLIVEVQKGP